MISNESSKSIKSNDDYKEEFRKSLPIYQHREIILEAIKKNDFLIITGETGSGKTTQLPQYIIESMKKKDLNSINDESIPRVVITQPRRVAAIQMAKRIAYEKNYTLGNEIGYTIRFEDKSNLSKTLIKFVTDGILVRECLTDKLLSTYNIVIIDEAHERSLYSDILFALVKNAVIQRKGDLKLIIMSATLNREQFTTYFNNCPLLKIGGKLFPVDITYHPSRMEKRVETSVKIAIRIHLHENKGHILAFLTGFEECEQACKMTYNILDNLSKKGKKVPPMMIMPLYGAQNTEDQAKIFEKVSTNCRKLIYCTNIAETSLTVDGVRYVIDCGYVKQKVYSHSTAMDSLMIVPISKVQAVQRAGRAGRTGPGKCLRLYTSQFYNNQMPDVIVPEILRVNLSSTILTLKSMGIDNVIEFDFMEKPSKEAIIEALKELYYLQAIDNDGHITLLGYEMAKFPIDCCYSRALIASRLFNVSNEMEILVSMVSAESPWINVNKYDEDKRAYFDKTKTEFFDRFSDHMTLLNIFKELEYNNFNEEWCNKHFLHIRALKQARNIRAQISDYVKKINLKSIQSFFNIEKIEMQKQSIEENRTLDDYEKINILLRMSLCQGFFMNAARKMSNSTDGLGFIRIIDGVSVTLDHFSALAIKKTKPELVMYTELGGTITKPVIKMVSIIELGWINELIIFLKNVNIKRLTGEKEEEENESEKKEFIDLYSILEKVKNKEKESKEDDKEEIKKRALQVKERYLQRKRKELSE